MGEGPLNILWSAKQLVRRSSVSGRRRGELTPKHDHIYSRSLTKNIGKINLQENAKNTTLTDCN